MTAPMLKHSIAQQLEEIDRLIAKAQKERPPKLVAAEHEFFLSRLQAVRRSIEFISQHKDEFLKLVEAKGRTDMLRDQPERREA